MIMLSYCIKDITNLYFRRIWKCRVHYIHTNPKHRCNRLKIFSNIDLITPLLTKSCKASPTTVNTTMFNETHSKQQNIGEGWKDRYKYCWAASNLINEIIKYVHLVCVYMLNKKSVTTCGLQTGIEPQVPAYHRYLGIILSLACHIYSNVTRYFKNQQTFLTLNNQSEISFCLSGCTVLLYWVSGSSETGLL